MAKTTITVCRKDFLISSVLLFRAFALLLAQAEQIAAFFVAGKPQVSIINCFDFLCPICRNFIFQQIDGTIEVDPVPRLPVNTSSSHFG